MKWTCMDLHVNISSISNVLYSYCAVKELAYPEYSEEGKFVRKCVAYLGGLVG